MWHSNIVLELIRHGHFFVQPQVIPPDYDPSTGVCVSVSLALSSLLLCIFALVTAVIMNA